MGCPWAGCGGGGGVEELRLLHKMFTNKMDETGCSEDAFLIFLAWQMLLSLAWQGDHPMT